MTLFAPVTDSAHLAFSDLLQAGLSRARRLNRPIVVSHTERVAWQNTTSFFITGHQQGHESFFWSNPDQAYALAGVGVAFRIETEGASRFHDTAEQWHWLLEGAVVDGLDTLPGSGPTLVGGFAFDPLHPRSALWHGFSDGSFVLPRFQLTTHLDAALLTQNMVVYPETDLDAVGTTLRATPPPLPGNSANGTLSVNGHHHTSKVLTESLLSPDRWMDTVDHATDTIKANALEKVVLARAIAVTAPHAFDLYHVLSALQSAYPTAYTFAVTRGDRVFLAATPERLVAVQGGMVHATALAGTTRRGATPAEDAAQGAALLASKKNRYEHAVVVEMLRNALQEACADIHAADTPQLLKLANVQHLYTPVTGRLRHHATLMDLIAKLHPTPAVGGLPSAPALAYIREHEGLDRGWYAAPVGWMDARKEGDFCVALRSGLVEGNTATLFAGCGIVAESDPASELEETRLKLQPMLKALSNGK